MTLVNSIERAGILFYLMKNAINVKKFKQQLLVDNFSWAALPTNLQKKMKVVQ